MWTFQRERPRHRLAGLCPNSGLRATRGLRRLIEGAGRRTSRGGIRPACSRARSASGVGARRVWLCQIWSAPHRDFQAVTPMQALGERSVLRIACAA